MFFRVPTAGGPYHWASALAPRWQRPLSYAAGWLLTLSWLCGVTSGMFLTAEEIRMVAFIGKDSADAQPYQTYLIVIGLTMMGCFINTVCAKYFALFELGGGALLALGFVVYLIVYAVMSPMVSAETVFGAFVNGDEWSNTGFGILTAQTAAIWLLIGI